MRKHRSKNRTKTKNKNKELLYFGCMYVKKVGKIHTFSATSGAQNYCMRESANYGVQINML